MIGGVRAYPRVPLVRSSSRTKFLRFDRQVPQRPALTTCLVPATAPTGLLPPLGSAIRSGSFHRTFVSVPRLLRAIDDTLMTPISHAEYSASPTFLLAYSEEAIEELEVLQAIYDAEMTLEVRTDETGAEFPWYCIRLGIVHESGVDAPLVLCFRSEARSYPANGPPLVQLECAWTREDTIADLVAELHDMYEVGEAELVYTWVEWLRDTSAGVVPSLAVDLLREAERQLNDRVIDDPAPPSPRVSEPSRGVVLHLESEDSQAEDMVDIITGDPLTDRKSKFVAHLSCTDTMNGVRAMMAQLLSQKKIANASTNQHGFITRYSAEKSDPSARTTAHNILAYRLRRKGATTVVDGFDDDGEHGAGGKMLFLLKQLKVVNIAVVVTRWYGGKHLGPDRFKHVNNLAKEMVCSRFGRGENSEVDALNSDTFPTIRANPKTRKAR